MYKIFFLILLQSIELFSSCSIKQEFYNGVATEYNGTVIDYTKGGFEEHTGIVKDFSDEATIIEHTGTVKDYTKGTVVEHTSNVVDFVKGTSDKHTKYVIDKSKGYSIGHTRNVRDYMKSYVSRHTGEAIDYARGTSKEYKVSIIDRWIQGVNVVKHRGVVKDYIASSSSIRHTASLRDYIAAYKEYYVKNPTTKWMYTTTNLPAWYSPVNENNVISFGKYCGKANVPDGDFKYCVRWQGSGRNHDNIHWCGYPTQSPWYSDSSLPPKIYYDKSSRQYCKRIEYGHNLEWCRGGGNDGSWAKYECSESYDSNGNLTTFKRTCPSYAPHKDGNYCYRNVSYNYYEYRCPSGYSIINKGYTSVPGRKESYKNYYEWGLDSAYNSSTPPSKNCYKNVGYDYYEYRYNDGTVGGYTSYTKRDPDTSRNNQSSLDDRVNSPTAPKSVKSVKRTYKSYVYQCPTGYTIRNKGSKGTKVDDPKKKQESYLTSNENSKTPPLKNCYKKYTYTYYSANCPSGYTTINGGYTNYTRIDPNIEKENNLGGNINNSSISDNNCYKDITYKFYEYQCPSGYSIVNRGYTSYTKRDPDTSRNNQSSLDDNVNSSNPPVANCSKKIYYNYYSYDCPNGYTILDRGLSNSFNKSDFDVTKVNETELKKDANSMEVPLKNCYKDITYKFYEYQCPNEYSIIDKGIADFKRLDNDYTIDNSNELSKPVNNSSMPDNNCYKDITYKFYEYQYPKDFIVQDKGYTSYTKRDPDIKSNNILELKKDVNSKTPSIDNASIHVPYKFYEYTCPTGYTIRNKGYKEFKKTDPDQSVRNFEELSANVNSSTPQSKNCYKEVHYNFYSYSCKDENNSQGYNWEVIDSGFSSFKKEDIDIDKNNTLVLEKAPNSINPPKNNCVRKYQECTIECKKPLVLDKKLGRCVASYNDICKDKGMVYDETFRKCVKQTRCNDKQAFKSAYSNYCAMVPNCEIIDGVCGEKPLKTCKNDAFTYFDEFNECRMKTACNTSQIVLDNGMCGSNVYCNDGDVQLADRCENIQEVQKSCAPDFRSGNICYSSDEDSKVVDVEEKRPLIKASFAGGYKSEEATKIINGLCSSNDEECKFRLVKFEANGNSIELEDAQGIKGLFLVNGSCTFNGSVFNEKGIRQIKVSDNHKQLELYNLEIQNQPLGLIQSSCYISGKVGHFDEPYSKSEIISAKVNDNGEIEFYDTYRRGKIGILSILPTIPEDDLKDGFFYAQKDLSQLIRNGFTAFTSHNNATYAVFNGEITEEECLNKIDNTTFFIATPENIDDTKFLLGESLYSTFSKGCIVQSNIAPSFNEIDFSTKITSSANGLTSFVCSPLDCSKDHMCQYNYCPNGFDPQIYQEDDLNQYINSYIEKITKDDVCMNDVCDSAKPYFPTCGNVNGCPSDALKTIDGTCVKASCNSDEKYDANKNLCVKTGCVDSVEVDGKCYKTLNIK